MESIGRPQRVKRIRRRSLPYFPVPAAFPTSVLGRSIALLAEMRDGWLATTLVKFISDHREMGFSGELEFLENTGFAGITSVRLRYEHPALIQLYRAGHYATFAGNAAYFRLSEIVR
ncbi:MAG: hypothetical protein ABIO86_00850 [Sphingomonas sp.]